MQSTDYQLIMWINVANVAINVVLQIGALSIAIIGWRRHRHMGYLLLVAWAVASGTRWFFQVPILHLMQRFVGKIGTVDLNRYWMISNMISSALMQCLLVAALALLVLRPAQKAVGAHLS